MDLQVIGRHALMFDDDAMAAFVNSQEALVEWNSLAIDRYDVRHLLSDLPPRKRSSQPLLNPDASIELELDRERYLDLPLPLPSPPPSNDEPDNEEDMGNATGFHVVRFSYGDPAKSSEQKDTDADAHFSPPFSVPDSLLQNLKMIVVVGAYVILRLTMSKFQMLGAQIGPLTEKVHQIIARTAMFVSKHGGQSEIILRVKQGDNPTFGFLMPDHHLHPYFRFLVDHQEVLISKPLEGENKAGALSLLGSVYGEDQDDPTEDAAKLKGDKPEEAVSAPNLEASRSKEQIESSVKLAAKEEVFKHPPPPLKEKPTSIKRNGSIVTTKRKDSSLSTASKMQASVSQSSLKVDRPVVEPPSELKRVIEKIVEFIARNGKQFETVLIEQDSTHGRFPFLLSSNLYHPYYLEVLQTEESELSGKGMISNKHETTRQRVDKKISPIDTEKSYESDRKEKFKMVIGKSKKDGHDPSEPEVGVCVDAAATAQILQAARKGLKYPNLGFLSKTPSNNTSQCPSSDGRQSSDQNSEAESAESSMTKEQKLKAERLKRAKLFTAMLKGGSVPGKSESSCSALVNNIEPESSFPINDVHIETEKSEIKVGDDDNERRSKRSYRSRPKVNEAEEEENNESEEERSRKRRKPHRLPSHQSKDRHKHSKRHSSRDKGSRHRHNHDSSSEIEEHYHSRHRCDDISNDEHLHSRDRDNSSSDNKHHRNSRHRSRHHDNLSDDNDKRSSKHRKRSESEREKMELEEGEISSKSDQSKASGQKSGASRESSVDISRWHNNGTSPPLSVPGADATDVSDDLRAKIRAMLMATL
ncbi:hypothetical protein ACFE04_023050 [Oxalis oulophora]